jgi:hypothetical protein
MSLIPLTPAPLTGGGIFVRPAGSVLELRPRRSPNRSGLAPNRSAGGSLKWRSLDSRSVGPSFFPGALAPRDARGEPRRNRAEPRKELKR